MDIKDIPDKYMEMIQRGVFHPVPGEYIQIWHEHLEAEQRAKLKADHEFTMDLIKRRKDAKREEEGK